MAERKRKLSQTQFIPKGSSKAKKSKISSSQLVVNMDVQQPQAIKRSLALIPEKKFFDTALSFNVDATMEVPATGQLALIPQGDTSSTRDGRQCVIESIQIRGAFYFQPAAAAQGFDLVYMYLVQDRQANGAAAAVTDVFTSTAGATNQLNLENSDRFFILKRWVVPLNCLAGVTTAYSSMVKPIEYFTKCNIPMQFGTAAVDITQVKSNNIFLIAGSGQQDDLSTFLGSCRLRFRG